MDGDLSLGERPGFEPGAAQIHVQLITAAATVPFL
jgi:hypothetical protein